MNKRKIAGAARARQRAVPKVRRPRYLQWQDAVALHIARDLERRGFPVDVAKVAATVTRLEAAMRNETGRRNEADAFDRKLAALWQAAIAQLVPPALQRKAQRKKQAAVIRREIEARAAELKQCGVRDAVRQAENEAAPRWGRKNGRALNRWRRRNR